MNDTLRAINFSLTYQNVNNLYKNFELLKLHDIYGLELAKFMYKLELNKFPILFSNDFVIITNHHKCGTRQATSSNYFLPRVGNVIVQNQLSFRGSKLWRTIDLQIKINYGIHLRNYIFSSYLTLTENLLANCNRFGFNYAITCTV